MAELSKTQDLTAEEIGLASGYEYKITVTSEASTLGLNESLQSESETFGVDVLNCTKNGDGYWTVLDRGSNRNKDVIIKDHNGELITEIAENAFINDKTLESITIPKSVIKIGANAFSGCTALKSVTIEDSGEKIIFFKNSANWSTPYLFYKTDSSTNQWPGEMMKCWDKDEKIFCFAIPYEAKSITFSSGDNDCITSEITNVALFGNNMCFEPVAKDAPEPFDTDGDGTSDLYITHSTKNDYYASQNRVFNLYESLTIAKSAFANCTALKSVTIPRRVVDIGQGAFYRCISCETLTFTDSGRLVKVGKSAFDTCEKLPTVSLPLGLATIGDSAFAYCIKLTTVSIPSPSLDSISFQCFMNCQALHTATFKPGPSVSSNQKLHKIGGSAFKGCKSLKEIEIPNTVKTINSGAFVDCTLLEKVNFKERKGWFVSEYDRVVANELIFVSPKLTGTNNEQQNLQKAASMLAFVNEANQEWYADRYWHRLTKMLPPTISRNNHMLTMTDPLGLAEKFYIYVNPKSDGSYDNRVTIESGKS